VTDNILEPDSQTFGISSPGKERSLGLQCHLGNAKTPAHSSAGEVLLGKHLELNQKSGTTSGGSGRKVDPFFSFSSPACGRSSWIIGPAVAPSSRKLSPLVAT